jgi:hypothetical protein
MSAGTLVPFMDEVALPGDSFNIDLECDVMTHPTIGPLFGSYKVQLDLFVCPIRLYNGKLHMNALNIGMNMASIKLPQMEIEGDTMRYDDNGQINTSCILSYLGIRGIGGFNGTPGDNVKSREFNALKLLMYWDIYKNYYANKMEENGAVIHSTQDVEENGLEDALIYTGENTFNPIGFEDVATITEDTYGQLIFANAFEPDINNIMVYGKWVGDDVIGRPLHECFNNIEWDENNGVLNVSEPYNLIIGTKYWETIEIVGGGSIVPTDSPKVQFFPLENIDKMREDILKDTGNAGAFMINGNSIEPYGLIFQKGSYEENPYSKQASQEGLALKTYQSDLFNNWVSTEWIDGDNGINAISSVDVTEGNFTIDSLNLSKKVYDMLNRIAVSGGSYDDWLDAVYTHERTRSIESPVYVGGLIRELAFQEVVSNASSGSEYNEQPLGTLAGKGTLTSKKKGGKLDIKINEPSYIMGIVSLTPRICYSQGNKWDNNLKTMDDFHKPALDEIGFQELITDQMCATDTKILVATNEIQYKSAGKQPAWINYMTNVDVVRGNFAVETQQMFMTLDRRYERKGDGGIKDLTTYIDPSKFNHIFADTRTDAQNFWTQISVDINARRKMSAKLMPNL